MPVTYVGRVESIVKKSRSFRQADQWNVKQCVALTPQERIQIAHALRRRAYRRLAKDVGECPLSYELLSPD